MRSPPLQPLTVTMLLPAFPDAAPTDFPTRNEYTSLNLAHVGTHPPSPGNFLSSRTASPASVSCPTTSSLETRRSTPLDPEQLQTPIFALSDLAGNDLEILTTHPKKQHTPCTRYVPHIPSSQEPTISLVNENELGHLRWSTGVPLHMMDVFRANPFAAMALARAPDTTLPSLRSSTAADGIDCGDSLRAVPMAKRKLSKSPESVEPRRKGRTKRVRTQSPLVVPFPATGPQEMYADEFMVDVDPPYRNMESSCNENNGCNNRPPSLSSGFGDGDEHLPAARSRVADYSEDTCMRLPVDWEDAALSPPSRFSNSYSHNDSLLARTSSGHHMHPYYLPVLPSAPLHAQMSPRFGALSNSLVPASRVDNDESWTRFEEHEYGSLPSAVPTQVMTENTQTRPSSSTHMATSPRKPFYACPLCPRDFQLPNGLALHLKWHDRVSGSTRKLAVRKAQPRNKPVVKMDLGQAGRRSTQRDGWEGMTSSLPFSSRTLVQGPIETVRK